MPHRSYYGLRIKLHNAVKVAFPRQPPAALGNVDWGHDPEQDRQASQEASENQHRK